MEFYNKNLGILRLIPLTKDSDQDRLEFYSIFSNKDIMKTVSLYDKKISKDENLYKDFFLRSNSHNKHDVGSYKVYTKDNVLVGITTLLPLKINNKNKLSILEFEYFLKPEFYNKKIGMDVAKFLINYGFKKFKTVKRIYATVLPDNLPSQIIMHKLGFKFVGKRRRITGSVVNLRYITRTRLFYGSLVNSKRKTVHHTNLINKINNKKLSIKDYSLEDL